MVSTRKSFGNVTIAGIFTAAALAAAAPAFAGTDTTITWNFFGGAQTNTDVGPSTTFTGVESPAGSLSAPLSSDLGITAYGEEVATTTTSSTGCQLDDGNHEDHENHRDGGNDGNHRDHEDQGKETGTSSTGPSYGTAQATDLYNKKAGGTENGLGLNGLSDHEISDTAPVSKTSKSGSDDNCTKTTTYETGMIQLDISNLLTLLSYANNQDATLTIGSLQSPDTAIISASTSLGVIGTRISEVRSVSNSSDQTTTFTLSQLEKYTYLNVTAAAPGQTVLLSTASLNLPSNSGNPTPAAPVPASAGLTLVGALGMGMMLLARRRRTM